MIFTFVVFSFSFWFLQLFFLTFSSCFLLFFLMFVPFLKFSSFYFWRFFLFFGCFLLYFFMFSLFFLMFAPFLKFSFWCISFSFWCFSLSFLCFSFSFWCLRTEIGNVLQAHTLGIGLDRNIGNISQISLSYHRHHRAAKIIHLKYALKIILKSSELVGDSWQACLKTSCYIRY